MFSAAVRSSATLPLNSKLSAPVACYLSPVVNPVPVIPCRFALPMMWKPPALSNVTWPTRCCSPVTCTHLLLHNQSRTWIKYGLVDWDFFNCSNCFSADMLSPADDDDGPPKPVEYRVPIPIINTAPARSAIIGSLLLIIFIASNEIKSVLIRITHKFPVFCTLL